MSNPLQIFHVFTQPQRVQITGSAARAAVPWTDMLQVGHSQVGDPGDEVVWICHCDIGQWGWIGPNRPPDRVSELGLDVFPTGTSPGFYESTTWNDNLPQNGAYRTNPIVRNGLSAGFMVRSTLDGSLFRFSARIGFGPNASQQVGLTEVGALYENVSIVAVNLTRATARGVAWGWSDNYAFPLPVQLRDFRTVQGGSFNPFSPLADPITPQVALTQKSTDARWLHVSAGLVAPGSKTDRYALFGYHFDSSIPGSTRTAGAVGHRARSQQPDNSSSFPHLQNVLIGQVIDVPANQSGDYVQLQGVDPYVAQGPGISRQSTAAGATFAIDLSDFQPEGESRPGRHTGATTFPGAPEWPLYGPAPGEPDEDEVDNRADIEVTTFVPTRKAVLCWATPRLEVSPNRWLGFRHEVNINDETPLVDGYPSERVHIVAQDESDALPCYVTAELATNRGALALVARGQFSPEDGPPSRIPAPFRFEQQTNAALFVAFNLFHDVQTTAEPPTVPPGPEIYVSLDPEAPDPGTLPRFPYQHDVGIEIDTADAGGSITTLSGRTLTWNRFLAPRRRIQLSWTLTPAMHELFTQWLEGLASPLVQYQLESELPRAYAIQNGVRTTTVDIDQGIKRTTLSMVEIVWTAAPEGGE